jgi:hypothetical protein
MLRHCTKTLWPLLSKKKNCLAPIRRDGSYSCGCFGSCLACCSHSHRERWALNPRRHGSPKGPNSPHSTQAQCPGGLNATSDYHPEPTLFNPLSRSVQSHDRTLFHQPQELCLSTIIFAGAGRAGEAEA